MRIFAYTYQNEVREIISLLGNLHEYYHPAFAAQCVEITDLTPTPQVGWLFDGETFSTPQSE